MAVGPHFKVRITNDVRDYDGHPLVSNTIKVQKASLEREFQFIDPLKTSCVPRCRPFRKPLKYVDF
jgi:hypothetical protein